MHETLEAGLRNAATVVAVCVAALTATTLLAAVAVEILRPSRSAHPLVGLADRVLPAPSRRLAAVIVATMALAVPGTAGAAGPVHAPRGSSTATPSAEPAPDAVPGSLRDWLTAPVAEPAPQPSPAPVAPASTTTSTTTTTTRPSDLPRSQLRSPHRARPARPTTPAAPPAPAVAPTPAAAPATVTVQPGDCLWSIAAARLGPEATNATIDAGWRAIWAANRDTVGADPNLIHPGLVLVVGPTVP